MFSNLPPFGLVQLQTLGGVYSGVSVIVKAPGVSQNARGKSASASSYTIERPSDTRRAPDWSRPHRKSLQMIRLSRCCNARRSYAGGVVAKLGLPVRIIKDARRPGQTVMLTQHCPGVFRAEQPVPLQDRDHLGAERVELGRQQGRHDIEP